MEIVANHLFQEVRKRTDQTEKNLFGRSAFNRCYYATFLHVRSGLRQLDPRWADLPHKDIPEVLKGTIRKAFSKGRATALKVSDSDAIRMFDRAASAALELSDLMTKGYATRVTADYYPEIQIFIANGPEQECFLNSVGAKEAKHWSAKSVGYMSAIVTAWSQIYD